MLRYLLDTNLCVRVLRDRPTKIRKRFEAEAGNLCINIIVLHELLFGAAKSNRPQLGRQIVDEFASNLVILPFDLEAAVHAADIRAELAATGQSIGDMDALIAGQARSRGLIVITGNLREFQRVSGLRSEDWHA